MHDHLFPRPRKRRRWYDVTPPRGRKRPIDWLLGGVVGLFAGGWAYGLALAVTTGEVPDVARRLTANPLGGGGAPEAAFVLDALVRRFAAPPEVAGESGAVEVVVVEPGEPLAVSLPDSLPTGVTAEFAPVEDGEVDVSGSGVPLGSPPTAPEPGIWGLVLRSESSAEVVPGVRVISQVPMSAKRSGRIGKYLIGSWPFERGGTPPSEAYETPAGLVEVTPENVNMPVSEHFTLGDFLTKGQVDVWPKYVALSPTLLDKLELTVQELEEMGHPVENVGIISGFRTPQYNAHGGNTGGRGSLSRHMYGDAMDFYIDNDRDGRMDDLSGDGRVDIADARIVAEAAGRVERAHPELVGGIGTYSPTGAHAGFVHVDTRGYRARW